MDPALLQRCGKTLEWLPIVGFIKIRGFEEVVSNEALIGSARKTMVVSPGSGVVLVLAAAYG